jgi:hypothetical protein
MLQTATAEQRHLRRVYIGRSHDFRRTTKIENRNRVSTWSIGERFDSTEVEKARLHWSIWVKRLRVSTWSISERFDSTEVEKVRLRWSIWVERRRVSTRSIGERFVSAEVERLSFRSIRLLPHD